MSYYVYQSCTGNIYLCDEYQEEEEECPMCGDYDRYIGCCETREEIADLLYKNDYIPEAIYEVTGLLPELTFRKPTQEEDDRMYSEGYVYYGQFD